MKSEPGGILTDTLSVLGGFLYLPVALGIAIGKLIAGRWVRYDEIECPTCGGEVSLLGLWECNSCHFRYYGFYFGGCPSCGNVPGFINCQHCEASILPGPL